MQYRHLTASFIAVPSFEFRKSDIGQKLCSRESRSGVELALRETVNVWNGPSVCVWGTSWVQPLNQYDDAAAELFAGLVLLPLSRTDLRSATLRHQVLGES